LNRRLELKTELLRLEGAGFNEREIVEQLHERFHAARKTVYYYYRTRPQWQPEILGLSEAKEAYHQTLNRLEYIYKEFSIICLSAREDSNKIGALKGMLETTLKKAELTGVLVAGIAAEDKPTFQSLLDQEALESLSPEDNALVMRAAGVFLKKRGALLEMRDQDVQMR
jgi:hypothetical protein